MAGETTGMRTPRRSRIALILLAFLSLAGAGAGAATLPGPVSQEPFAFQRVGSGDLRWFGMHIYEASLWSPDGRFDGLASRQPMALSLWYGRDFSREELLRITGTAWKLLGETSAAQQQKWIGDLRGFWLDVAKGHNLTAVVVPGGETRFYDQQRLLGRVDDPQFGPAFLAIWLHPRSVVGDLRGELLGGSGGSTGIAGDN
jgi:hypothetical protein